jgi:hypothetical protein
MFEKGSILAGSARYAMRGAWAPLLGVCLLVGGGPAAAQAPPAGPGGPSGSPELGIAPPGFFDQPPLPPGAPMPGKSPQDLDGTWYHADPWELDLKLTMYGKPLPFTAKGKAISDRRHASKAAGRPIASAGTTCRPVGQAWALELNSPWSILKSKNALNFVFMEFHSVWVVRMNQPHRTDGKRTYMGDSVGHWEGDTLVVDTTLFSKSHWIDTGGAPLSKNAHLIHRMRKTHENNRWALEVKMTIDDPEMYTEQWSLAREYLWRPEKAVFAEYNCEMQTGLPDAIANYGAVEEEED